ncbi:DNA-(apurinic or apyrimidinic site) lyase [Chloracidobacterium thermophilum B]|uniref:Endonuclease III n=2 Tax=Chloracidobacterium thermophilum TaxID=458033 RepID=G2LI43_CHLTF|nr:DNA-(apurinic or apyrimidinic site) lyase [Chloracidobacterium thermophilum B]
MLAAKPAHRQAVFSEVLHRMQPSKPKPISANSVNDDLAAQRRRMQTVIRRLRRAYPDARCSLNYRTPLELLVATILSAQCTDERVNLVTRELFQKYRTAADYARADLETLQEDIRSTGFYRNKAKALQGMGQRLVERFGGEVPRTMEDLLTLPGVARKTANVVLGNAFGQAPGVVVDTHVTRLARRLGFSAAPTPEKIERDLMAIVPRQHYVMLPHWFIFHGRAVCRARNPQCQSCILADLCPSAGQV